MPDHIKTEKQWEETAAALWWLLEEIHQAEGDPDRMHELLLERHKFAVSPDGGRNLNWK